MPDDKDEQQDSPYEYQQEEEVQEQLQREFYDNDDIPPETFPDDLESMTGGYEPMLPMPSNSGSSSRFVMKEPTLEQARLMTKKSKSTRPSKEIIGGISTSNIQKC